MTYLRFGTRDLLWAMAIVGLAFGWALEYRRHSSEQRLQQKKFEPYVHEISDLLWQRTEEVGLLREKSGISDPVVLDRKTSQMRFASPGNH